ncbi:Mim2p LALA0_S07e05754g [Lachancea lanzarotensis]|uniref:LALA0S07e05754g1_1 n=1 Tax=Lachancea lanzarotensis TaxID=1245769 RepID=A0A0C7N9L1_9SACH|nr:uncharacterized protein LALA0_S07e05754g [Lachancea lanzarotensis]CEP63245.1 LALA0S07e05754g1_1 [Lachancea lanzarotensis]
MSSVWDRIRQEQVLETLQVPQSSQPEQNEQNEQNGQSIWTSEDESQEEDVEHHHEDDDDEYSDLYTEDIDFEEHLLTAQQQWEESLEQLSQVLNWVLLPLIGKYLGRRTALGLWKRVVTHLWGI